MPNHRAGNKNVGRQNVVRGIALGCLAWLLQPGASAQSDAEILEAARACQRQSGLSARIACYDRVFPPIAESLDVEPAAAPREERRAVVAETEPPVAEPERALATTVQIVEVQMPSLDTTRFRAADGRVFVRSSATTVMRWPEPPFDVEIQVGAFGTTYLELPSGSRIRVAVVD